MYIRTYLNVIGTTWTFWRVALANHEHPRTSKALLSYSWAMLHLRMLQICDTKTKNANPCYAMWPRSRGGVEKEHSMTSDIMIGNEQRHCDFFASLPFHCSPHAEVVGFQIPRIWKPKIVDGDCRRRCCCLIVVLLLMLWFLLTCCTINQTWGYQWYVCCLLLIINCYYLIVDVMFLVASFSSSTPSRSLSFWDFRRNVRIPITSPTSTLRAILALR